MVPAQRLVNLPLERDPVGPRVPLPEKDKSLPANPAPDLSVSLRAPAKDLHSPPLHILLNSAGHDSQRHATLNIPRLGERTFRCS